MSSNTLYRLSGFGLLLGGIIAAIGNVLANIASSPTSTASTTGYTLSIAGGIFVAICFVSVYLREAGRVGIVGLLGFLLLMLSRLLLAISYGMINLVIAPLLTKIAPDGNIPGTDGLLTIGAAASILGVILFSIASIRAAVFPRWIPIVLLVGFILNTVVEFIGLPDFGISSVLFQLGFAGFGFALLSQSSRKEEQATVSSAISGVRG